jgi:hypothetical protein
MLFSSLDELGFLQPGDGIILCNLLKVIIKLKFTLH